MGNELKIFTNEELENLKELEQNNKNSYVGFFYILEWDDIVKIGSSNKPYQRYKTLQIIAENYGNSKLGRIAISQPHTNYRRNEILLHNYFKANRQCNNELFNMCFEEVIANIPKNIEYLDETKQIEQESEATFNLLKKICFQDIGENQFIEDEELTPSYLIENRTKREEKWKKEQNVRDTLLKMVLEDIEKETKKRKGYISYYYKIFSKDNNNETVDLSEIAKDYSIDLSQFIKLIRKLGGSDLLKIEYSPSLRLELHLFLKQYGILPQEEIQEENEWIKYYKSCQDYIDSLASVSLEEQTAFLQENGCQISAEEFVKWLQKNDYLLENEELLSQKSIRLGLFEIEESITDEADGNICLTKIPKVTGKGQIYFINKFLDMKED